MSLNSDSSRQSQIGAYPEESAGCSCAGGPIFELGRTNELHENFKKQIGTYLSPIKRLSAYLKSLRKSRKAILEVSHEGRNSSEI